MLLSRWLYYLSSIPTLLRGAQNPLITCICFLGLGNMPCIWRLRSGLRFVVRSPMDMWIVKESCLDASYERHSTLLQPAWTVLDIGAGIGDFSIHAARLCPQGRVIACEPAPDSFALLQQNIRLNGINNIETDAVAIGEDGATLTIDTSSKVPVRYQTMAGSDHTTDAIPVPSHSLAHIFAQHGVELCDYVKMDCEGAEYGILNSTPAETVQRVRHWCLEYHDNTPHGKHQDLVAFFQRHGFMVQLTPNPAHRTIGWLYAYR